MKSETQQQELYFKDVEASLIKNQPVIDDVNNNLQKYQTLITTM